jgi:hypothetical protein
MKKIFSAIIYKIKLFKYFFKFEKKITGNYDVIFFGEGARALIRCGKKSERLVDSTIEDLININLKCISIDNPFSDVNVNESWGQVRTINQHYLIALLLKKLFFRKDSVVNLYKKLLKKTKVKIVFCINARPELCKACNEEGVLIVEVLHGMGYTFIPWGWAEREKSELPNCILALDNISLKTFAELTCKGLEIYEIEHPFNKKFLIERYRNNLPHSWKTGRYQVKQKKIILISLAWGYENEVENLKGILNNGILYDDFSKIFRMTEDDILWGLRLHQIQLTDEKYKHHINFVRDLASKHKNVEWIWFSENPLPMVLESCDGLITMSSMSCYDAASFGVKTLALCPTLRNDKYFQSYFNDLELKGYLMKKEFSVNTVLDWVKNIKKGAGEKITDDLKWRDFVDVKLSKYLN